MNSDHINETIITIIESEDIANVYTHKETWKRYFRSQGIKPDKESECGGADFTIPKKWVLCPRNRSRIMTDEQRDVLSKRMKRLSRAQKRPPILR